MRVIVGFDVNSVGLNLSRKRWKRFEIDVTRAGLSFCNCLEMTWKCLGYSLAMAWQWLGNGLAMAWQWLGNEIR